MIHLHSWSIVKGIRKITFVKVIIFFWKVVDFTMSGFHPFIFEKMRIRDI